MGATGIEWTKGPNDEPGFTFNPWIGCTKVSAACDNCYAETASIKLVPDGQDTLWGPHANRRSVSDATWDAPKAWNRRARREGRRFRVFCASMADVLDNHHSIDDRWRSWLYELIFSTPNLDWLLLTKRPENARKFLPDSWFDVRWPRNVWFGITAENQRRFNHAARWLPRIPATVRFLSVEPMLEFIKIEADVARYIDWLIAGGESGRLDSIRPTPEGAFANIYGQCLHWRIPFFMKQLDQLRHRKLYKEFARFPAEIRVREHPQPRLAA